MLGVAVEQMSSVLSWFLLPALTGPSCSGSQTPKSSPWVLWWKLTTSRRLPVCQLLVVVLGNWKFLFMTSCELQINIVYICLSLAQEGTVGSSCRQRDRDLTENTHFLGVAVTLAPQPPATRFGVLTSLLFSEVTNEWLSDNGGTIVLQEIYSFPECALLFKLETTSSEAADANMKLETFFLNMLS